MNWSSFFSFLLNKNPKEPLNLEDEGAKSHKSWRITSKLTPYTHPPTKRGTLSPRRVFSSSKARILKRAQREKKAQAEFQIQEARLF